MEFISETADSTCLLKFLDDKCNTVEETNPYDIYFCYVKVLKLSLINTYKEQGDYNITLSCTELIHNIFTIIYNYSLNVKLAMFISERSILLFNEYLNISKLYNNPVDIGDIKQFIINKSIGPIKMVKRDNTLTENIEKLNILKECMVLFFQHNHLTCDINVFGDVIDTEFCKIFKSIIHLPNSSTQYIEDELLLITNTGLDDLEYTLFCVRVKFETAGYLLQDIHSNKSLNDEAIEKLSNLDYKKLFKENITFQKKFSFKKLLKNYNLIINE
tara:strand:+ start:10978 stop:11796 length:819 start_codon:yes stop_codon:yes gene_type:complete